MNWRTVWTIFRKEVLDTVRDRRTLIMMLGVPIVLYPGLTLLMVQVAMVQQNSLQQQDTRVALAKDTPALLGEWLQPLERLKIEHPADPDAALTTGDVDVVVVALADFAAQLDARQRPSIELRFDATELRSRSGADRVGEILQKKFDALHDQWLKERSLTEGHVSPFKVDEKNVASEKKKSGTLLGITLPALLIIMLALGAFYPAVDLTAGEKERGTFETLLSTPCSKLEIVTGKFMTVFGLSLLTALLNFASMAATLALVISQARGANGANSGGLPEIHLDLAGVVGVLLILLPLALLISALMMSIAVFARSYKEAQNYMTPFVLLITLPAMIGALPGIKLTGTAALVPVANVVLLFKDLMTGEAKLDAVFAVLVSNSVFAGLALLFAAWLFQREDVVLGGGALSLDRRAVRASRLPSPGLSLGAFFTVFVLIMYLGTLVQGWRLLPGLLITEYVLILGPALGLLWYFRVDFREALSLRAPSVAGIIGALLCGLGALVLVMQVGAWHNKVLPVPQELQEAFAHLFSEGNLAVLLFVVALAPALCEEALFRGVIFAGLKERMHPAATILLVGALFGLFHLSIYRMLPTGLLGVVLTYFVWRTGSIYPGMLVHALVNGASILIATGHVPHA